MTQFVDWSVHCGGTSNAIPWLGFTTTFQPLTVAVSVSVPRGLVGLAGGEVVLVTSVPARSCSPLAVAGSRGNNGARSAEEIAGSDPKTWVYGQFTQPDRNKVRPGTVEPFTTNSGIKGTLGTAWSVGVKRTQKCATNGKAWTFAFKNPQGDLASWTFFGAKGVYDEVPDETVRKIAATVRLYKDPSDS